MKNKGSGINTLSFGKIVIKITVGKPSQFLIFIFKPINNKYNGTHSIKQRNARNSWLIQF